MGRDATGEPRRTGVGRLHLAAIAVVLLLALLFVPMPRALHTPVFRRAFDFLHAPLFAGLFLVGWWYLRPRVRRAGLVAAGVSVAVAGLSELLQLLASREASASDLLVDVIGVGLAWAGVAAWSRGVALRAAHALVVAGSVAIAALSVGRQAIESRELAAMMPLLAGFEQPFELDRWHAKEGTRMQRTSPGHAGSAWALEVRCSADVDYPGVSIEDFDGDWRGYRWLEWSARVPSGEALSLSVRLDDDQGAQHGTRYTESVRILPPREVYRIDLRRVAAHFREHPMNMSVITELHFFLDEPRVPRELSLDEVRLVP